MAMGTGLGSGGAGGGLRSKMSAKTKSMARGIPKRGSNRYGGVGRGGGPPGASGSSPGGRAARGVPKSKSGSFVRRGTGSGGGSGGSGGSGIPGVSVSGNARPSTSDLINDLKKKMSNADLLDSSPDIDFESAQEMS